MDLTSTNFETITLNEQTNFRLMEINYKNVIDSLVEYF